MKTSKTNRIIRLNLNEQAAKKIKTWILSVQLKPGDRLIVDNLAEELGISRTPVREGLQKLVAAGLVVYDGKSYMVMELSKHDIENLFEIRRVLEALAARQAGERISRELLDKLWEWYEECKQHQQEKDIEFLISHDMRFHQLVREGAGNSRLKALLENLHDQIWWVIRLIFSSKVAEYQELFLLKEHLAVLECIANHDPGGAARMMEKHIRRSETDILKYIEQ